MGELCTYLDHLISVRGQMGFGAPVREGSKPYSGLIIIITITLNHGYSGIIWDAILVTPGLSWFRGSESRLDSCDVLCTHGRLANVQNYFHFIEHAEERWKS